MPHPPSRHAAAVLAGRGIECARLDQLLAEVRAGRSAVLVLRGEPGIGKSALLEYAARRADGWHVLRARGAEWEMELPFAGLHQLCAGLLDGSERLPSPQRDALAIAFGLSTGAPPDRFLVGLAVLGLLSEAAEERPQLCVVDDVQWLDRSSAQVLAFVARRLAAEAVGVLFAVREPGGRGELPGLPELQLGALPDAAARELLASVITAPLDERVLVRILAETRGNPLALQELPRGLSPAALAGGFAPGDGSLPDRIEASYQRRARQLPAATQRVLLLAAADPTGEPALLVRGAAELGIPADELADAEADGLLAIGLEVSFAHPLLRSAIYRAASAEDRREVHRALAAATDAGRDPDRRAWHRAHATAGPDEDVARELEQAAERARARGGVAAAGAFLERAAGLTTDPGHRARRALEAAASKHQAGDPRSAEALLATAATAPLDEVDRARLMRLHGQVLLDMRRAAEALPHLAEAARRLEPIDPVIARGTHLEALRAAIYAGRFGPGALDAAAAARAAPPRSGKPHPGDLVLEGLAVRFTDGYAAGVPALRRALAAVLAEEGAEWERDYTPWMVPHFLARRIAPELLADDAWHAIAEQGVQVSRENGALAALALGLNNLAELRCLEGELDGAAALVDEADGVAAATGIDRVAYGRVSLAGYRGIEAEALVVFDAAESAAIARGDGVVLTSCEHARAVLYNGLGRYEAALAPARSAAGQDELWISVWSLPELVEAAARCGQADVANAAIERLTERTRAADTDLALGIEARSRALLGDGAPAERLYGEAIDRLARTRAAFELARARLLYGEWLRHEERGIDARDQLRRAEDMFTSMGGEAFAARAGRELLAVGEPVPKRAAKPRDSLTAQEMQIAQLARDGLSNPEIGAQLFISPRTVEYHLHKVFAKVGISTREHLDRVLGQTSEGTPALR